MKLFPACAGVILIGVCRTAYEQTFPRMRGGDPAYILQAIEERIFSPHARG